MIRNAVKVATARLGASLLATLALLAPAWAGDRAVIDFIGYSGDSRYFAFEEFGVQDGSGFAYSNIYVIDLSKDSWVVGTPFRVRADDEEATLAQIRAKAQAQAEGDLETLGINTPVEIAALIGDGVPDAEAQTLDFGVPGYLPGMVSGNYKLQISSFATTAASPCKEWFDLEPQGYELTIAEAGKERLVHRDGALPRSRGCSTTYRLYGVVLPFGAGSIQDAVGIVSVYPQGFEGPDRRFVAVPLGL